MINGRNKAPRSDSELLLSSVETKIEWLPIETLRINIRNARKHSKKQIRQIANSILAHGFLGLIIIDENGIILAGHGRFEAAKLLRLRSVPTQRVTGLTEVQKRAFAIADNKIGENAGYDREILVKELGELSVLLEPTEWDISLTGFEPAEIDALFKDLGPEMPDPAEELPSLEQNAISRPGDLWIMNRHRLGCGDARSSADIDHVMHGAKANMVFTDPPYNQKLSDVQGRGHIKHAEVHEASGEKTPAEYIAFLVDALGNSGRVSHDGATAFVCEDWRHLPELHAAALTVYDKMLNLIVWVKTTPGQGSFYRSQHELIGVFRKGQTHHQNNIQLGRFGINRSNVWTYAGMNTFGAGRLELLACHPTVKPVALVADAIRDCTTRGDIVLDPFLGSGTTILAAEKVGRRGYGVEYEPRYVDVSIRRWESYTKQEAVLEGDGRTFAEVRAERLEAIAQGPQPTPGSRG
jgi:DNA modification methylase